MACAGPLASPALLAALPSPALAPVAAKPALPSCLWQAKAPPLCKGAAKPWGLALAGKLAAARHCLACLPHP